MKYLLLFSVIFSLTSCNTAIGVWRDTKMGYRWTKGKINNMRNSSGGGSAGGYSDDAPIY